MKTRLIKLVTLSYLLAVTNFVHAAIVDELYWNPTSIDFGVLEVGESVTLVADLEVFCLDSCDINLGFDSSSHDFEANPLSITAGYGQIFPIDF